MKKLTRKERYEIYSKALVSFRVIPDYGAKLLCFELQKTYNNKFTNDYILLSQIYKKFPEFKSLKPKRLTSSIWFPCNTEGNKKREEVLLACKRMSR